MAATIAPTDHDQIFVAWQSFCCASGDVSFEEKLRGDNPIVTAHRQNFVRFGTPRSEYPSAYDHAHGIADRQEAARTEARRAEHTRQAAANRVTLTARVLRCTADLETVINGQPATLAKGSTVLEDSSLAIEHPNHFA